MAEKEVDLLGDAIAGTEAEIFGEAVDGVETDVDTGTEAPDRSLETMDEVEGTEATGEGDADEADGEGDADGDTEAAGKPSRDDKTGKFTAKDDTSETADAKGDQAGRKGNTAVPLREERQKRQVLETELEKERRERATEREGFKTEFAKLEGRLDQILRGQTQAPVAPKAEEPKKERPDKFVDPDGYDAWVEQQITQGRTAAENAFTERLINMSMADAHEKHGKAFETAFQSVSSLDRSNPANAAVLRNIREAPNPGAALMRWHQQQETLREVGGDPAAYRQKIAEETKSQLLKDPEFRKQLIEEMKAEAGGSTNSGRPRNIIRTPPSLNGASGRGEQQLDPRTYDNSEGSVFESAFGD